MASAQAKRDLRASQRWQRKSQRWTLQISCIANVFCRVITVTIPPPPFFSITILGLCCHFSFRCAGFFYKTRRKLRLGSPRPSTEPKTRNPKKSPKKVSGTPRDPKKVPKKVRKVQKIVKINYFLDFSDFCWNFFGGPGGSQRPVGRLFWRLFGGSGFWAL